MEQLDTHEERIMNTCSEHHSVYRSVAAEDMTDLTSVSLVKISFIFIDLSQLTLVTPATFLSICILA